MATTTKPKKPVKKYRKEKKSRLGLWTGLLLLALVGAYLAVLELSRPHVSGERLRFDVFMQYVEEGRIKDAKILDQDSYAVGFYQRPSDGATVEYNAPLPAGLQNRLAYEVLAPNRVETTIDQQVPKKVASLAAILLPGLMLVVLFGYLILSYRRGSGLFSIRSGARKIKPDEADVTFADVAGQDAAVAELREIKDFLKDPERFTSLGASVPKGVLLFGPPGCGKTMIARALAGESQAAFYSISGSDFIEVYVGVGASRVRDLFREARANAPALIFIDELDSIGRVRGRLGTQQSHSEQEQALNQILAEMDGFSTSEGIIVIGATNRPDVLDPALLRPGRFDRTVGLESPNEEARLAILNVHAKDKVLGSDVNLGAVASRAHGLTGADLASVMNEGALLAARAGRRQIGQKQLLDALKRVQEAPERQRRLSMRSKSIGHRLTGDRKVSFTDVAGQNEAVAELSEIREFLVDPEKFTSVGAAIPKGVLLYGPPGCGKTMLAKALASEANAAFVSTTASEFMEVFPGEGASRVRDLFAEARAMPPAIVFIDELDAIGRSRANAGVFHEQEQTLNQVLAEMDGFSESIGVIVVAATNRPDVLDPALLRPGRFDRTIGLELPDDEGRLAILRIHAKDKVLGHDVDLAAIASRAFGLTGADLASVMNEAALLAGRAEKEAITQDDLEQARSRIMSAPERQRRLSMRNRRVGKRFNADERVSFDSVAGIDDAVAELSEVREYLTEPERFKAIGARVPRGILVTGPPGCGKTLLARAVAGEANAAFFSVAATEFVEVFVGEGAARVRDLFADARSMAPSIVFLDELDAVGGRRSTFGESSGRREVESTLNQLLVELDGFDGREAVIVMGATNRPDMLDSALTRPGRFDRQITISLPDRKGRREILELYARERPLADDVDLEVAARLTMGLSGADLENVVNEAALLSARNKLPAITMAMIEEGIDRAIMGVASRGTILTEEDRRVIAYHEAGHALVAVELPHATPPHKLTIIPRGSSLGRCTMLDKNDRVIVSRSTLVDEMAVFLGGWAAEQLVLNDVSSGASSDLDRVGDIARRMVREFGMSEVLGPLGYRDKWGYDGHLSRPYSEASAQAIDEEVRLVVDEAAERARHVLRSKRNALDDIAEALLDKETLSAEELGLLSGSVKRVNRKPASTTSRKPAAGAKA